LDVKDPTVETEFWCDKAVMAVVRSDFTRFLVQGGIG